MLEPAALERLKRHRWPGNVRELENLTLRLAALYLDEVITVDIIEAELSGNDNMRNGTGVPAMIVWVLRWNEIWRDILPITAMIFPRRFA